MQPGSRPAAVTVDQELWGAVLEAALDCIIVMDASGRIREFNPAAERTFGYSRSEALGQRLADLIVPPELRARHEEGLRRYLETGDGPLLGRRLELHGVRRDGERVPVELAIVPFKSRGERLFAGYVRDMTERLRAREEIRRRTELSRFLVEVPLAASTATTVADAVRACLASMCRFMSWPLGHAYFLDPDTGRLVSRDAWCVRDPDRYGPFMEATRSTTFARGEGLPGRAWERGEPVWVLDAASEPWMARREAASAVGLGAAFAVPVAVGDDSVVILEFFADDVKEPDEELLAALPVVSREIGRVTERVQAAERLRAANEELAQEAKSRQRFLSMAAHELAAPLSAIKMQLALLRRRLVGDAAARHLAVLERNVARLETMQRDLTDAGRIGAGRLVMRPAPGDLHVVASESVASMEPLAQSKGIELQCHATPTQANFDRQRIGQVLDNLLRNAIRFTSEGGKVHVRVTREGEWGIVEVADTGHGIDPADIPRLFRPFSQVHDDHDGSWGGSGLGLFISRGIALAHGGDLTAHSEGRGRGATFRLRLPLDKDAPATAG